MDSTQRYNANLFFAMLAYLRPQALFCVLGGAALMLQSYLTVLIPAIIKDLINGLETGMTASELHAFCGWIVLYAFLAGVMLFLGRWFIIGASRRIETAMRNDLFAHILRLTPRFFHNMKTGDLMTRFSSDIEQVRMLVGPGIMYPTQFVLLTSMAFSAMLMLDTGLTAIILGPVLALLLYVNYITRKLHTVYRQAQEIYSAMAAKAQENLSGIRVVKAYCQEEAEFERFREINERYLERNIEQIKLRGLLFPFMRFVGGVGIVLILWFGGLRVIRAEMTLGDLVQFALYFQMLMWPIIALGWIINVIHRGVASWRRIRAIMETEPDVLDPRSDALLPDTLLQGQIEVRNLTFAYDSQSSPVLRDVSFTVAPGQTLAIVGPTGCGKSTIVNILLHLYAVPRDCVFFDGRDINDIPRDLLRRSIAYVSQEVFLFSDTIRNNILFGAAFEGEFTESELMEAIERAQLSGEIDGFSNGLETEIGERGITLSGGQKQRAGIARALILHRPILILDDCLSAVDTNTEEAILRGLSGAIERSTAILISHRISTVKNADHIIVLDEGRVVEEGNHLELLEGEGLYARIHSRQLLEEILGIRE